MRWSASIAAGPSGAMGTPIVNTAAAPAMTSIESEGSAMMSKRERRELERMRLDGYGPTRIAEELELSVNTVKSEILHPQASQPEERRLLPAMWESRTADAGMQAEEVLL